LLKTLDQEIDQRIQNLNAFGYRPGEPGIKKVGEAIVQNLGIDLPRTPKSNSLSMKHEYLAPFRHEFPFVDTLLSFEEHRKLKSFIAKLDGPRVHSRFSCLKDTGRTSSSNPNLQNLPRDPRIRGLFIPKPGHIFINADYAQIELCTLAQVCLDRFGFSKMSELINSGTDIHRWFASIITGKSFDEIGDESVERQSAKACNFGFPGGLGVEAFLEYARVTYGLSNLTLEDAEKYKEMWLTAFPEMKLYLADTLVHRHDFTSFGNGNPEMAAALFRRVVGGNRLSRSGHEYDSRIYSWAFTTVMTDVAPQFIGITQGSPDILDEVLRDTVVTRTGRVRARTTYCEARNTLFQGLAADGAKIALYRLTRAGFCIVNFIHDEIIIEVPVDADVERLRGEIEKIMIESMNAVVPAIKIKVKSKIKTRWEK
jgi:DNA polymerase I-like protein with 3'-5' exonuclease and polymerase domains